MIEILKGEHPSLDISEENLEHLLQKFSLDVLFVYGHSAALAYNTIPLDNDANPATVDYHCIIGDSDLRALFSYDAANSITQGICWGWRQRLEVFEKTLHYQRQFAPHPFFIMFVFVTAHSSHVDAISFRSRAKLQR